MCDATRTESLAPCLSRSRPVSMCQESAVSLSLLSERPSRVSTDGYHLSSGRCGRCSEDALRHCSSRCRKPALSSEKQMKQKSGADTIKGVLAWFQQVMPQARLRMFPLRQRCKSGAVSDEQELGSPPQISASPSSCPGRHWCSAPCIPTLVGQHSSTLSAAKPHTTSGNIMHGSPQAQRPHLQHRTMTCSDRPTIIRAMSSYCRVRLPAMLAAMSNLMLTHRDLDGVHALLEGSCQQSKHSA